MKYKIIVFFLTLVVGTTFAQKVLTSKESIQIALQRNTSLQKSEANLNSYESNLKTAYGALLPNVGASASWNWNRSEFPVGNTSASYDSRTYGLGVNSTVTLFDGLANYSTISKGKTDLESAKYNVEKLRQDIVFQTLSYYYDVINAQKLLKVKEDDVKWNQKNYEIIVERNKLGAVTLADVYSQQVKLGNAELELLRAQNSAETLKSNFLYYLGLDVLEAYSFSESELEKEVISDGPNAEKSYEDLKALVENALVNRADYASAKLALNSADNSLSIAKAGYLPSLQNTLAFGYSNSSTTDFFKNRNYSAGLTLSIPIFSGWRTDYNVELATIDTKIKQLEIADLLREIKRSIQKNYLDLQTSYKQLDVSKKNVIAAEENRRIEEEKYALGSTTLLNVLIANSEYTNAVTSNINAQYEFRKYKDEMQYLLGNLKSKNFE